MVGIGKSGWMEVPLSTSPFLHLAPTDASWRAMFINGVARARATPCSRSPSPPFGLSVFWSMSPLRRSMAAYSSVLNPQGHHSFTHSFTHSLVCSFARRIVIVYVAKGQGEVFSRPSCCSVSWLALVSVLIKAVTLSIRPTVAHLSPTLHLLLFLFLRCQHDLKTSFWPQTRTKSASHVG